MFLTLNKSTHSKPKLENMYIANIILAALVSSVLQIQVKSITCRYFPSHRDNTVDMRDEFFYLAYQSHSYGSAKNSGGLHLICRWHQLSSFALHFHHTITSSSHSHPQTSSLCCWITTLRKE